MKPTFNLLLAMLLSSGFAYAQEGGNRINQGQQLQQGRDISRRQPNFPAANTDSVTSEQPNLFVTQFQFIDARVLTSLETKEYVAVFGLAEEADKVNDANKKLQEQVRGFLQSLVSLGVRPEDTYLDFVSQNRVYDIAVKGSTAKEKVSGFQ